VCVCVCVWLCDGKELWGALVKNVCQMQITGARLSEIQKSEARIEVSELLDASRKVFMLNICPIQDGAGVAQSV